MFANVEWWTTYTFGSSVGIAANSCDKQHHRYLQSCSMLKQLLDTKQYSTTYPLMSYIIQQLQEYQNGVDSKKMNTKVEVLCEEFCWNIYLIKIINARSHNNRITGYLPEYCTAAYVRNHFNDPWTKHNFKPFEIRMEKRIDRKSKKMTYLVICTWKAINSLNSFRVLLSIKWK